MIMELRSGTRLGDYEIVAAIGAGGMGQVYRASDRRLRRDVAIKVLPERDAQTIARFKREARAAASLSHPNILEVYQFGFDDGVPYLVTELLEGETLRQLVGRGDLQWRRAVEIAIEISEGLAAAHAKGIVHRDLKPENVFVTGDGRVKILDFGLARLEIVTTVSDSSSTAMLTTPGTVMGTLTYMSPEQLRGERADAASDLFALGSVLHEMIGGRPVFARSTSPETLSAILRDEPPDLKAIRPEIPAELAAIVTRCLDKEKGRRYHSAHDLAFDLKRQIHEQPVAKRGRTVWPISVSLAIVAAIVASSSYLLIGRRERVQNTPPAPAASKRLTQLTSAKSVEQFPSWGPDGTSLVYSRETADLRKIFMKSVSDSNERQLTRGDFDDIQPAWSPDGKTILFVRSQKPGVRVAQSDVFAEYDGGDIWTLDAVSGMERRVLRNASQPAWSVDGSRIAFAAPWSGPHRIWISDSRGHNTQQVTTDTSEAVEHISPKWSPDGTRIVFQHIDRTQFDIRIVNLANKELMSLTSDATLDMNPLWTPSGRAVLFSSYRGGGINVWRIRLDAAGKPAAPPEQLTTGAGQDIDLDLSRDGKRLAFATLRQNADLWRLAVSPEGTARGEPEELVATTREDSRGAASADSNAVAFNSDRGGEMNIWVRTLEDGVDRQVTSGPGGDFQPDWSPDGSRIVFFSGRAGSIDIWEVTLATGALRRLTSGAASETHAFYSPDGGRLAYMSDADGRLELWVMNADGSGQRQLTRTGISVHFLRWTRDGSSIYFQSLADSTPRLMSVPAGGGDPQPTQPVAGGYHFSFSPDRSRIMDVLGHRTLWVSPMQSGKPEKVFEFDDREVRIDYPSWSPDGKWVIFDRLRPEGGDIWMLEGFE